MHRNHSVLYADFLSHILNIKLLKKSQTIIFIPLKSQQLIFIIAYAFLTFLNNLRNESL